ncbi:DUF6476 family protein [Oceanicella actignis]|uniref:Uncharacterized protein n=1 Tax=Oceanicella actignis TaxID=1189325 RepID=A0A1M7SXI1_9RHOB|nr:DUF6476 family protein [Oceanicella actignis]SES75907.1 hypothetical protein SAMN04488119_101375 [Oceanicella actignis]SHN63207.1 hypothetical protein SAMN05216200_103377 [Oceanicella actignis]
MTRNLARDPLEEEEEFPEPPRIKALRRAVMGLMLVLALGMALIAATIAWRLTRAAPAGAPAPVRAESLVLPEGAEPLALGGDAAAIMVLTRMPDGAEWLLGLSREDGRELYRVPVRRAPPQDARAGD